MLNNNVSKTDLLTRGIGDCEEGKDWEREKKTSFLSGD
jgi:hypothetical protein